MVSLLPVAAAAAAASTADCAADCCDAEPLLPYRRLLLRRPRYAQLHDFFTLINLFITHNGVPYGSSIGP